MPTSGSLLCVLALAILRNGQVVQSGVAQVPFFPGRAARGSPRTVEASHLLHRFVEVGARRRRGFFGSWLVVVEVLGIAREQAFERYAVHHGLACSAPACIRLHRREGMFDLFGSAVLVVGSAVFTSLLGFL